jgi:hypothetical protein
VTVDAPQLRVVTDVQWTAAHRRLEMAAQTYAPYARGRNGQLLGRPPTGLTSTHLLTGLSECGACHGGFMVRHAGQTARGRRAYYVCTTSNNRGRLVCGNTMPLPMAEADDAVLSQVRNLVLNPDVVEGAIREAVSALRPAAETVDTTRATLTAQVRQLDAELSRLAAAVASGGDFAALLEAIREREQKRTALCQRVEALNGLRQASAFDVRHIERELRARLTDWRGLLGRHTPIARQMLVKLLDGRVVFTPKQDGLYAFHGRAALGKVLQGLVPQVFEPRSAAGARSSGAHR